MKYLFLVAALLTAPASAFAGDLTVEQTVMIERALVQMSCASRIIKDGGNEKMVCDPIKWTPGLSWQIATVQQRIHVVTAQYNRIHDEALSHLERKPDGDFTAAAMAAFAVQDRGFLDQKADVDLPKFKRADIEDKGLQPWIIAALMPIIEDTK